MADIEERVTEVEKKQISIETKFDMFMNEMRDRDNQRAEDIRELRQRQDARDAKYDEDMRALNIKHDADMKELRNEMQGIAKEVRGLFIAAVVGSSAIVITVFASMVYTATQSGKAVSAPVPAVHNQVERDVNGVDHNG